MGVRFSKFYVQGVTAGDVVQWHLLDRPVVYESVAEWLVQKERERSHAERLPSFRVCLHSGVSQ